MKNLFKKKAKVEDSSAAQELGKRHERFLDKLKSSKTKQPRVSNDVTQEAVIVEQPLDNTQNAQNDEQVTLATQGFIYEDEASADINQTADIDSEFNTSHLSDDVRTPFRPDTHPELDMSTAEADNGKLVAPSKFRAVDKTQWLLYGLFALLLLAVIAFAVMMLPQLLGGAETATTEPVVTNVDTNKTPPVIDAENTEVVDTNPEENVALVTDPEADPEVQAAIAAALASSEADGSVMGDASMPDNAAANGQPIPNDGTTNDTAGGSISYEEFLRLSETPIYIATEEEYEQEVGLADTQNTNPKNIDEPQPTVN